MEIRYGNDVSLIGGTKNQFITTQKDGSFSAAFTIDKPAYYTVCYNTVYLSPGDTLIANFSENGDETVFKGRNAALNDYLKKVRGSHLGGYYSLLTIDKKNTGAVDRQIDSIADVRRDELKKLETASPEFLQIEAARIDGEVVTTYFSIPFYQGMKDDEKLSFLKSKEEKLCPIIKRAITPQSLHADVVRDIWISSLNNQDLNLKDCVEWQPRMEELYETATLSRYLDSELEEDGIARINNFLQNSKEEDIKQELQAKSEKATKLRKGSPAPDLQLSTPDGKEVLLSSYKGKAVCIDIWATWCGPCVKEYPLFQQLAEKYNNRDIVFLAISIDTDHKQWLQYLEKKQGTLPQYNCIDTQGLNTWNVMFIPHFILIDKDFNIYNAQAPAPSSKEKIEAEIEALLQDK
ncbi:MAG: redoxin family protein [Dysgonamonadaceae bacterium]|nr:redoxin family protein [Dysgonamonadaceae bacterium]